MLCVLCFHMSVFECGCLCTVFGMCPMCSCVFVCVHVCVFMCVLVLGGVEH